jgi:aspartyl protease family protein
MATRVLAVVALACLGSFAALRADEVTDAKDALAAQGIRAFTTGITLAAESDFSKELVKAAPLKKALTTAIKEQHALEQLRLTGQQAITQMRQQAVALNAQLVNVQPNDVETNNRLVAAINALENQQQIAQDKVDELGKSLQDARAKTNSAREAYIQLVIDARRLADRLSTEYVKKAADPGVVKALATLAAASGKKAELAPSTGFLANVRKLKTLEDTVLSESIDLQEDAGKTLTVSVVLNGKYQQSMAVDSGSSLICLPLAVAEKFGLKPTANDPQIILRLADGRDINAHKVIIPSVRVGKFTVDNVECAVLSAEAVNAEPMLGMSFLREFKFEIDPAAKKLTMVKVAGTETGK